MRHEYAVPLTDEEAEGRFRCAKVRYEGWPMLRRLDDGQPLWVLPRDQDGTCVFLAGNRCSIHAMRPEACRRFNCLEKFNEDGSPGVFLRNRPDVLALVKITLAKK